MIEPTLTPIESASTERIGALSTSEFAPILNSVNRKPGFAVWVIIICLGCFLFALNYGIQIWLNLILVYAIVFIPVAILLDRYRRSVWVEYLLEGTAKTVAQTLAETFNELKSCGAIWQINAEGSTSDWKRNAGATALTSRKRIHLNFGRPTCIRGNFNFPALELQRQSLYFLPDTVLVAARKSIAALPYQELVTSTRSTRFIEDEAVPSDASIVGQTWRFVNKKGGPDRRFNNNRQLPICIYGEMDLQSKSGLNCKIEYTKSSAGDRFSKAMAILHRPESLIRSKPITSFQKAKTWPSVFFWGCFLLAIVLPAMLPLENAYLGKLRRGADANASNSIHETVVEKSP